MNQKENVVGHYLNPLQVWALSFGCAVGWGAFVMPGNKFLPLAGPLGTALGILLGAFIMLIVGVNYHYLINKYPEASGGTMTYTANIFGYDHGFLTSWFLLLVYIAIIWANASALGLISKYLLGNTFRFGFRYEILGYEVYMGEVMLSMAAMIICGVICTYGKRFAANLQTLFALILIGGIILCYIATCRASGTMVGMSAPGFAYEGSGKAIQIISIAVLSPWAFVGFESVSNSTLGFNFSSKKIFGIILAALITGSLSYIMLTFIATFAQPEGFSGWRAYISSLDSFEGLEGLPVFFSINKSMGQTGIFILGLCAFAGMMTGIIGNLIACSRLIYAMADEGFLPGWFKELNKEKAPSNAIIFITVISLFIPFLGRTAIGWIVDVTTIGATIVYTYTSAAAFVGARKERNLFVQITGIAGIILSLFLTAYFIVSSNEITATESYLILIIWSVLGFIYFRFLFDKDTKKRFGKSTVVWVSVLLLIFATSLMWIKKSMDVMTLNLVQGIREYYESLGFSENMSVLRRTEDFIDAQLRYADKTMFWNSVVQMIIITVSLAIMLSLYSIIARRERKAEIDKLKADEMNKAKTIFLSNMSHDIRTPMNAIIGYINIAEKEASSEEELRDYLAKIKGSSNHLLALINDVLEMSRIESGKMELEPVPTNLKKTVLETKDLFGVQMTEKKIDFAVDVEGIKHRGVYCDRNRLNRLLLNLISNAYKFTPEGGKIAVMVSEQTSDKPGYGRYEIRVRDTGIGMSEEFASRVFEAFEREHRTEVDGIQGTGLGMSICKSIVDLMGGKIECVSSLNKGTEFIINVDLKFLEEDRLDIVMATEGHEHSMRTMVDLTSKRVLLVDDMTINRKIATMQLEGLGLTVDQAENGKEALDMLDASVEGLYDAVLTDIQMPVMNGYEVAAAIRNSDREDLRKIPIIAMTANAFSEDIKRAHDSGMNAHVAKPIDMVILENTLRDVLAAKLKEEKKADEKI
ncbi:amino acid permease [Butyrivibrio sp. FCS014]|uniref:amino acid permease n=1 Tax=Butyrivibrio sp. FCS014 TaxID=1408304 RepID=UPI0004BCBE66|nr:amino acid permease [Butyrivibrio sp. FCS014]